MQTTRLEGRLINRYPWNNFSVPRTLEFDWLYVLKTYSNIKKTYKHTILKTNKIHNTIDAICDQFLYNNVSVFQKNAGRKRESILKNKDYLIYERFLKRQANKHREIK